MNEDLESILKSCRTLLSLVHGNPMKDAESAPVEIVITSKDSKTYVGSGPMRTVDGELSGYYFGSGETLEAAARDWRARLVRQAKTDVERHEQIKAWLNQRNLLG